jgi:ATP-binding cassette, subfamily C (CFTR/MRP), member 1
MSFFVNTDSGVTMNRFSQDLQLIDMELPIAALNTFASLSPPPKNLSAPCSDVPEALVLCIAQMILIGIGSIFAAISFPVVLLALFIIQKIYLRTSRQLRLLDLEAKAPLYSLFEASLSGLPSIRAFSWQSPLEARNHTLLDRSQRWLTLILDLVVAAVAVVLIVIVVELRGTVNAGGVGLALLNVIQFSQTIKLLVTFWTTLETHIGSVARVKSFTTTAPVEDRPGENGDVPKDWPSEGKLEFSGVKAAYR